MTIRFTAGDEDFFITRTYTPSQHTTTRLDWDEAAELYTRLGRELRERKLAVVDPVAAALDAPIDYEHGVSTVGGYLEDLLRTVWNEGEGFSGKRPFGNSGWHSEVYAALVKAGVLDGEIDSDGYAECFDSNDGDRLVLAAIERVFEP